MRFKVIRAIQKVVNAVEAFFEVGYVYPIR
jgi:hypothetical protein